MEILKTRIEERIKRFIQDNSLNTKETELMNDIFQGGKRLRPMICLAIGDSHGKNLIDLAIAIELIHNASLIIDDLPCMDNDLYRRDKMTIHHKYGSGVAIQIAVKIFALALNLMYKTLFSYEDYKNKITRFNQIIYENIGHDGLPYGQYLDLEFLKKKIGLNYKKRQQHQDLIFKKTTTLFNLSFLCSYVLLVTDLNKINVMRKASKWFGLAFQLYDDFQDIEQDKKNGNPNFINQFGEAEAYSMYLKSISKCQDYLNQLEIKPDLFNQIFGHLQSKISIPSIL